jgi:hypothetical protein
MQLASTQQAVNTMGAPPQGAPQVTGPAAGQSGPPQAGPPGGPTQPAPQQDGTTSSIDPSQIFDPTVMSRLVGTPPFRQWIQQAAENAPLAGSYLRQIADQVKDQKGPLY